MKLRAYLVDDEPLALERLRRLLEQTGRVEVIGSTTESEQAVAALTADTQGIWCQFCRLSAEADRAGSRGTSDQEG